VSTLKSGAIDVDIEDAERICLENGAESSVLSINFVACRAYFDAPNLVAGAILCNEVEQSRRLIKRR